MSKIQEVFEAVEKGKSKLIEGIVQEALAAGDDPMAILNDGMVKAMGSIGEKFQKQEVFVPEMLIAARTMKKGVEVLKPKLGAGATAKYGKCIIGTVQGDLHDIGKNLVSLMIESQGFQIVDLGVDVTADSFLAAIKANPEAKVVALSALLTTTMPAMKATAEAIKKSGAPIKLIVGGAPITKEFADSVGADGTASDAAAAAELAKKFAA
jgi:methanogenic corrinoid protein MtbC1